MVPPLYKYITGERIDILKNGCLRFTQPHRFNDPFEMQLPITSIQGEEEPDPGAMAGVAYIQDVYLMSGLYEKLGILCLTEKWDNLLMWAHYSDHHRGMCLEFDAGHSFFDQPTESSDIYGRLCKVLYSEDRPSVSFKDYLGLKTFVTKSVEWEYEQEWRIIVQLEGKHSTITHAGEDIHLFEFPPDSLTGVILGCRMQEAKRREITDFLRSDTRYHVEIRQAELDRHKFCVIAYNIAEAHFRRGMENVARAYRYHDAVPEKSREFAEAALPDLSRAIELDPTNAQPRFSRGAVYQLFIQEPAKALDDYNSVIELDPSNTGYLVERGKLHVELQHYDEALADFDQAVELGHDEAAGFARQLREQAEQFTELQEAIEKQDWESVIRLAEHALKLHPTHPALRAHTARAYKWRGYLAQTDGNYQESIAAYDRSLELSSEDADTYFRRGHVFAVMKNDEKAAVDLDAAIERNDQEADYYYLRALVREGLNRNKLALADLDRAIELDGNRPDFYDSRAFLHHLLGDTAKAEADRAVTRYLTQSVGKR